jgi:hypothetical protein
MDSTIDDVSIVFSFGERLTLVAALRDAIKGHESALRGIARRGGTNAATADARAHHEAEVIDLGVLLDRFLLSLRSEWDKPVSGDEVES